MTIRRWVMALLAAAAVCTSVASSAEYFVNKKGRDSNNGASRATAFLTIQKGVNALKPGDTLTIGPGEYFENVERADLGNAGAQTVIRAEIRGTAVLRGDVPAPEFKRVDGYRFVYAAPVNREPNAVIEHNGLHTLLPKPNVPELEFDPGCFHYDARGKTLYLSNPDLSPAGRCRYTLAVNGKAGLLLTRPRHVVIDGLAATGFYPDWGIRLGAPVSCTVRNCVCFMNVGGITLQPLKGLGGGDGGSGNVVESCVCYGNTFGGIVRYGANNDVIRGCYTYRNVREGQEHFGVMHYSTMTGPLVLADNISWGQNFDYSVKPGNQQERLERCVGLGFVRIATGKMAHNLIDGGNEYGRNSRPSADTVLRGREKDLDQDREFADPLNLDFRLQSDSCFRSASPDGSDRGPYAYKPNIFYVSPAGDDRGDGLSMRKPWRTLARALKGLRPGDTLYLAEGRYVATGPWENAGDGKSLIQICGRGRKTVVIADTLRLAGCAGVAMERLDLAGGAALAGCRDVTFRNCTFSGTAGIAVDGVEDLNITHCLLVGATLRVAKGAGVTLSGNIFASAGGPAVVLDSASAIRYSDYNDYQDPARCWEVGGAAWSFDDLRQRHDLRSLTMTPQFASREGVPRLANARPFRSVGPLSTAMGVHYEYDPSPPALEVLGPFVHSTSCTTANIEWWASRPARYSLAWGESLEEMKQTVSGFRGCGRFNTFSMTGLTPGRTYHFRINAATIADASAGAATIRLDGARVTFTTAAAPAEPCVYYVAPDGKDTNDGLARKTAFRTVCRAAGQVGPGDTVLIAAGDYPENVRIRAAGTERQPITFRCIAGEKVNMQAADLPRSFEVIRKPDQRFDGLYFRGEQFWREGFVVRQSPRVRITRCLSAMVIGDESPEMLIRNCVLHGGWNAVELSRCDGSIVENNAFVMTILRQIKCSSRAVVRRNIFCECTRTKTHQTLLELSDDVTETDNCFYLRWPEAEKLAVNDMPLPQYRARTGSNAFVANPMMPGTHGWQQGWWRCPEEDFDKLFATNPMLVLRGAGLQPEAFADFHLGVAYWSYDRAWAEKFVAAANAAEAMSKAGKDVEALAAYDDLLARMPMSDRLRADVLAKASCCAERLKNHDKAMQLAKEIPVTPLAMHRQMQLMLAQKQYAALLAAFSDKAMGGRSFYGSYIYPELEDVMADLYDYRARAFTHAGDLVAAEADLRVMNDKRQRLGYVSGEAIHDRAWLRLGDFYRTEMKNDDKALSAYLNVCTRTTWAPYGIVPKPVATGGSETLAKATEAACAILSRQGKQDEAKKLRASLAETRSKAAAALSTERPAGRSRENTER